MGATLDWRTVGKIYDALDDLLLPHRFSLIVYDGNTHPDVAAHIARWEFLFSNGNDFTTIWPSLIG